MSKDKYIFDDLETALYLEGKSPKDYLPKHGMPLLKYVDEDLILQLSIYTETGSAEDSVFAWIKYIYNTENGMYDISEAKEAIFNGEKGAKDQVLPSKKRIGLIVYNELTGNFGQ